MDELMLKVGSTGRAVGFLQSRLGLPTNNTFDDSVHAAVAYAQVARGLKPDGIYGPVTNRALTRRRAGALEALAGAAGIHVAAVEALIMVETAGFGFHDNGLPKLLLERHYVWANATPEHRAQLPESICSPHPGGYLGGLAEWERLESVASVCGFGTAAACCSWGLPQIIGDNYLRVGASSIYDFVRGVVQSEDEQLKYLIRFIISDKRLITALCNLDWATVAQCYNGKADVDTYASRLENAYNFGGWSA